MEQEIKRFIKEYEKKIDVCDVLLENIKGELRNARQSSSDRVLDLLSDRRNINAVRQAYVQALADFKSCIGEI